MHHHIKRAISHLLKDSSPDVHSAAYLGYVSNTEPQVLESADSNLGEYFTNRDNLLGKDEPMTREDHDLLCEQLFPGLDLTTGVDDDVAFSAMIAKLLATEPHDSPARNWTEVQVG